MNKNPADIKEEFQNRLQWLMLCRVMVASFFLGIAIIAQLQRSESYLAPHLIYLYGLTAGVFVLTFIYASLSYKIINLKLFCYSQIMMDILLITALLFITGGINSIFPFMYSISIISASILLYRSGSLLAATGASFCYSLLVSFQYFGIIHPLQIPAFIARGYSEEPLVYPVIVNITAFYLVALLSSFVSEQARKSRLQLKEKQIDIKTLEALNENIIQSINSGLLTLDAEGKIITFNKAAEQITGLTQAQVYQRHIAEIFGDSIKLYQITGRQTNGSIPVRFEAPFTKADGKVLQLGISSSILKNGTEQEIGNILAFQDLTLLKEMEEYVKRMDRLAAIGRLAAGIAHEVRNPLASIRGSVQVLQKNLRLSDSDKRLMEIVLRESDNLNGLISNFIQFARPNTQKKEPIQLKHLVDETLQLFHNSAECRGNITISQNISEDIYFKADPQQFKQVIWNLLINAAQAINDDRGEITLTAHYTAGGLTAARELNPAAPGASPKTKVEIIVRDSGCGIGESEQDKIFEPFYTTKERGTGLGLSIVYRIIEELGGTISVDSSTGHGASFIICIPQ
ncbi:MAG: ATP-binding protein [Proteobacteria bacterium]|nr:ATP-binding protein [Pseudomonadota bacterium]